MGRGVEGEGEGVVRGGGQHHLVEVQAGLAVTRL